MGALLRARGERSQPRPPTAARRSVGARGAGSPTLLLSGAMSPSRPADAARGRVGVREVAELAGVSTQTVSRVLNDSPSLREDTRGGSWRPWRSWTTAPTTPPERWARRRPGRSASSPRTSPSTALPSRSPRWPAAARDAGRWIATAYADAGDEESVEAAVVARAGPGGRRDRPRRAPRAARGTRCSRARWRRADRDHARRRRATGRPRRRRWSSTTSSRWAIAASVASAARRTGSRRRRGARGSRPRCAAHGLDPGPSVGRGTGRRSPGRTARAEVAAAVHGARPVRRPWSSRTTRWRWGS